LAFSGRRDWLWRRIFLFVLGTFAAIIFLCLGASGYQSSVPHNNVLLAFWPLGGVLAVVLGLGVVLAIRDAFGPHYVELRIGEQGLS
jgi:hypothetical protein